MIIPKDEIKYVFNVSKLRKGDILLINTYDRIRRLMPGCKYDHAAMYIGDAFLIESDGTGVVQNHIFSYAFKDELDACVMRLKDSSIATIENVVTNTRRKYAMGYGTQEARMVCKLRDGDVKENSNRTFCSRLVSQAYHDEGIDLVKNPDYCSPDDFLNSEVLIEVEGALQLFTDEMTMTVMNAQDERNNSDWNDSLAEMFEVFRNFYQTDIQTFDQFIQAVIENKNKDEEAEKLLNEQKWMTPYHDLMLKSWPFFYDDEKFLNHFSSTEGELFFIRNQFLHYDITYLPIFLQNKVILNCIFSKNPDSKVILKLKEHSEEIFNESVCIRERLAYLYTKIRDNYKEGFYMFVEKYGEYKNIEYQEPVFNMDSILNEMLRGVSI